MTTARPLFHAALTADFFNASGEPKFRDLGLTQFSDHSHVQVQPFAQQIGRAHV